MVLIDWTLVNSDGDVIGLHTQGVEGSWVQWEYGDPGLVRAVGRTAAKPLAALIGGDEAPAAFAAAPAALLLVPVRGAPGDGDRSLARAMRLALEATDVGMTDSCGEGNPFLARHRLRHPARRRPTAVRVVWTVTAAGGAQVARLTQESAVPEGGVDGPWNRLSAVIAAAVAADIEKALGRMQTGP